MSRAPSAKVLSTAERIYNLLLYIYPTAHRLAYSTLLTQMFRDLCHDAYRQAGIMSLIRLWSFVLTDTVKSAAVEHIDTIREGDQIMTKRQHRIILLLAGLPLMLGFFLFLVNPVFMGQMLTPNAAQPIGWLMTAAVFILVGAAYTIQRRIIIRAQSPSSTSRAADGSVSPIAWTVPLFVLPALLLVVFGPAVVRILNAGL
jgi:hypothetical protein